MNNLKNQVEALVKQEQFAQAFDAVLQAYCQAEDNDHQRDNIKRLLLQVVLSIGKYSWDDLSQIKDIQEAFMDMLKNDRSFQTNEFVAACLLRLLSEPSVDWIEGNRWRPVIITFLVDTLDASVC